MGNGIVDARRKIKSVRPSEVLESYIKMQHYFFDYPTKEWSLNDLSSLLHISKTTAKIVVNQLIQEGFLTRSIIGRLWRISCNGHHEYHTTRKIPYHLNLVYESGILPAVHEVVPHARSIVLFGSYRKGDDDERSDIDIAVEIVGDDPPRVIDLGSISQMGYRKDVPVHVYEYSRNNVHLNVFANIANGILLQGFLEVRP
jgi:hypothetical protein